MAEQQGRKTFNTFVQGFITEASGISFPENATVDEANFVLNRDGSRQRRLGFDYEAGNTFNAASTTANDAKASYLWEAAGPGADTDILVIQVGATLYFYDADSQPISANEPISTVSLTAQASLNPSGTANYTSGINTHRCDFSDINGALFVVSRSIDPFYVEYNNTTITSPTRITLKERDFEGVKSTESGVEIDQQTHPTALDKSHEYNLRNQSWDILVTKYDNFNDYDPVEAFNDDASFYPSNSDILWFGFLQDNIQREWRYKTYAREGNLIGTAESPRGHFILNSFNKTRDEVLSSVNDTLATVYAISDPTNIKTIGDEYDKNRPECIEVFAGRVWYSGVRSSITTEASTGITGNPTVVKGTTNRNKVYYSRSLTDLERAGHCYQKNDPTSEELNELVASDGGVISINEAGIIYQLVSVGSKIYVFASNGVWEITGEQEGAGFAADAFKVNRLSNVGVLGRDSVVNAESAVFYWSIGGIYVVGENELGVSQVQNITETTIQTFYVSDINEKARASAIGYYDEVNRVIRWLYNDSSSVSESQAGQFNAELIFDTVLKAWYKHTITSGPNAEYLAAYAPVGGQQTVNEKYDVFSETLDVVLTIDSVLHDVVQNISVTDTRGTASTKYLVIKSNGNFGFGTYNNTAFLDWGSENFSSFMVTGYETFGDPSTRKQARRLVTYFKRTEQGYDANDPANTNLLDFDNPSSCYIRARWDWDNSGSAGKWGSSFQAYRLPKYYQPNNSADDFDYGYDVIATKNRLRGSGRALSLYIASEQGKDMHLLGWTLDATNRTNL